MIIPRSVKLSSFGVLIFPLVICVIGFRLYIHPKNPDAWFIWAVLQVVYGFGALLILKGFGFIRWLWGLSLSITIVFGSGRIIAIWHSPYSYLAVWCCLGFLVKIVLLALLFTPSTSAFFRTARTA